MICLICNKKVKSLKGLSRHIKVHNISSKQYYDKYLKSKNDGLCSICGNKTEFRSWRYLQQCSKECKNINFKEKSKITILKKYGVENPYQIKSVKEKISKVNRKKSKESLAKRTQTNLKRYGVENVFQSKNVKEKIKQTNLKRYGHENGAHGVNAKNKRIITHKTRYWPILIKRLSFRKILVLSNLDDYLNNKLILFCNICKKEFITEKTNEQDIGCGCLRNNRSINEIQICEFLDKYNIEYIKNYRHYYNNKNYHELDIYIPSHNLGIEFNGIYWHSELLGKDKNYHLNKTNYFQLKQIQVIHIFENEWLYKRDIVQSLILNRLGLINNKIYARKCDVRSIDSLLYKNFLEDNHIQGPINSKYRFGLFYKNELVSIIGFGKSRFNKNEIELHRFCSKINNIVVGGFSRLIRHSNFNGITYCDRRYFDARGYKKIGFKEIGKTSPNYWYFSSCSHNLKSRIQFQKHKLKQQLKIFDSNLTEWENMQMNGWNRIWDCGNIKLIYSP